MPSSTDDIVGVRQQIQDNMNFLRPDGDHTVLLVKSGGDYQVVVMETGVAYNKTSLVAFGAHRVEMQDAYRVLLSKLSVQMTECIEAKYGESEHVAMLLSSYEDEDDWMDGERL